MKKSGKAKGETTFLEDARLTPRRGRDGGGDRRAAKAGEMATTNELVFDFLVFQKKIMATEESEEKKQGGSMSKNLRNIHF